MMLRLFALATLARSPPAAGTQLPRRVPASLRVQCGCGVLPLSALAVQPPQVPSQPAAPHLHPLAPIPTHSDPFRPVQTHSDHPHLPYPPLPVPAFPPTPALPAQPCLSLPHPRLTMSPQVAKAGSSQGARRLLPCLAHPSQRHQHQPHQC